MLTANPNAIQPHHMRALARVASRFNHNAFGAHSIYATAEQLDVLTLHGFCLRYAQRYYVSRTGHQALALINAGHAAYALACDHIGNIATSRPINHVIANHLI